MFSYSRMIALTLAVLFTAGSWVVADSAEAQAALSVHEVLLSNAVADHRPVDPKTAFARSEGRLYATVHVLNPARTETTVTVQFRRADGTRRARITLNIPARGRYRTLARFNTAQEPGNYEVVVMNAEGEVLSTTALTISE